MLKNGGGAIVNTASVAGLVGNPGLSSSCAAKHGVAGLTRAAALDYIGKGVRINAVCPEDANPASRSLVPGSGGRTPCHGAAPDRAPRCAGGNRTGGTLPRFAQVVVHGRMRGACRRRPHRAIGRGCVKASVPPSPPGRCEDRLASGQAPSSAGPATPAYDRHSGVSRERRWWNACPTPARSHAAPAGRHSRAG